MTPSAIVWITILFEGALVLLALLLGAVLGRPPVDLLRWSGGALLIGGVATLPLVPPLVWSTRTAWRPFVRLRRLVEERVVPLFAGCSLTDLILISLAAGCGEELLFRGVLLPALAGPLPTGVALVLVSLLFGLAHPISPLYVLLAAGIGLYLGGLLLLFDNLLVPVVVHALYDLVALVYLTGAEAAGLRAGRGRHTEPDRPAGTGARSRRPLQSRKEPS